MQTIGVNAIDAAQSHLNLPLYVPNQGGASSLFHFNQIVLVSEATDLRAGMDTLRTKAIQLAGEVAPHEAYVFLNRNHTLLKLVVHDAMGTWLCTRRLHEGGFRGADSQINPHLRTEQLQALALGLPWQRLGEAGIFRHA